MLRYFVTTSRQKFNRQNTVMPQKAMNAVRVEIARAIVMKRQDAVSVARQKERARKSCWPSADYYAIVKCLFTHIRPLVLV